MNKRQITFKLLANKAKYLAVHIVALHQDLTLNHKEFYLSQKLIENGTIIGEKITEMSSLPSKEAILQHISQVLDYLHKTHYWLNLLFESGRVNEPDYELVNQELAQLEQIIQENFTIT
ncbi:four helix bundle protein [uncultured Microscilla sp.]|uniref:four helix bundle protein n=1 Tax=uncultured Microscilla sp. TaxID=432653 RepID=UPI00262DCC0D|nr:four helix bundle protein [uncultured Microscilla sp.]